MELIDSLDYEPNGRNKIKYKKIPLVKISRFDTKRLSVEETLVFSKEMECQFPWNYEMNLLKPHLKISDLLKFLS